jgi:hypothetical protein
MKSTNLLQNHFSKLISEEIENSSNFISTQCIIKNPFYKEIPDLDYVRAFFQIVKVEIIPMSQEHFLRTEKKETLPNVSQSKCNFDAQNWQDHYEKKLSYRLIIFININVNFLNQILAN